MSNGERDRTRNRHHTSGIPTSSKCINIRAEVRYFTKRNRARTYDQEGMFTFVFDYTLRNSKNDTSRVYELTFPVQLVVRDIVSSCIIITTPSFVNRKSVSMPSLFSMPYRSAIIVFSGSSSVVPLCPIISGEARTASRASRPSLVRHQAEAGGGASDQGFVM